MSRAAQPAAAGGRQVIWHEQADGSQIGASQCTCYVSGPMNCPIDKHRVRHLQQEMAAEEGATVSTAPATTPAGNGVPAIQFSLKTELITEMVPLSKIRESKTNPRKHWDAAAENELTASVKQHGVIQPITVRPLPSDPGGDKYEIVAGARRFRAAKAAGNLAVIPARIVLLTDEQALEVQLVENLQREGIGALDEALGFRALQQQDEKKWTPEAIAEKVGKSVRYVYARMKLCDLGRDAKKALAEGTLSASHADELVRLQPADQERALHFLFHEPADYGNREHKRPQPASVRELKAFVAESAFLDLSKAPFDTASAKLLPEAGACSECPKRAGNNPLFQGAGTAPNTCTDSACYNRKTAAMLHVNVAELKKKGEEPVLVSHQWKEQVKKKQPGVLYDGEYEDHGYGPGKGKRSGYGKIGAGECPDTRLGVFIDSHSGDAGKIGATIYVCTAHHCKVHSTDPDANHGAGGSHADAAAARRRQMQKKFRAQLFAAILDKLSDDKVTRDDYNLIAFEFFQKLGHYIEQPMLKAMNWPKVYGDYGNRGLRGFLEDLKDHDLVKVLLAFAIAPDLNFNMYGGGQKPERMLAVAARHKIDAQKIMREVQEEADRKKKKKPAAETKAAPAPAAKAAPVKRLAAVTKARMTKTQVRKAVKKLHRKQK